MGRLPRILSLHGLGTATDNFLKRWIAFMIGGVVALVVELVLFPVKARARLVESLTAALCQINEMERCIASGIEEGSNFDVFNANLVLQFDLASAKAKNALGASETFRKDTVFPVVRLRLIDFQSHFATRSLESKVHSKASL